MDANEPIASSQWISRIRSYAYKALPLPNGIVLMFDQPMEPIEPERPVPVNIARNPNGDRWLLLGDTHAAYAHPLIVASLEDTGRIYIAVSRRDDMGAVIVGMIQLDPRNVGRLLAYLEPVENKVIDERRNGALNHH